MKKTTKNTIAVCLIAAMSIGMGGCGKNETADDIALSDTGSVAEGAEAESALAGQSASSELFREEKDGKWWFDTSRFDPSKYDGKLYLDGIEITLPLTVQDLYEDGIYCDTSVDKTVEGAQQEYETGVLENDDEQSEQYIYREVDGALKSLESVSQITIYNLNEDEESGSKLIKNSKVGTLGLRGSSTNEAQRLLDSLKLEGIKTDAGNHYLDVESLMEAYGPPCFYVNASGTLNSYLYYYYGDYSLEFAVMGEQVYSLYYIGTEYLEADELHTVPARSDTETAYMEAYSKLK